MTFLAPLFWENDFWCVDAVECEKDLLFLFQRKFGDGLVSKLEKEEKKRNKEGKNKSLVRIYIMNWYVDKENKSKHIFTNCVEFTQGI